MKFQLVVTRTYFEEVEAPDLDQAIELLQNTDYVDWAYNNEFSVYDEEGSEELYTQGD